jgi:site-specific DNA-methyltransferase (adenine-specific)
MYTIYNDDCLKVHSKIEDDSVDMILVDLPYGTTACEWDSIIPMELLWQQYNRIAKENAAMIFTGSQPFTTMLAASNIKNFRYEWIWEKPQGTNPFNAKVMPLKSHENVLVFYRKKPLYNPQMESGVPYSGFKSNTATIGEVYGNAKSVHRDNPEGTRYPKTILRFKQEKGLHPTQKPVALMEYLIKTYTNAGDTVLDSTMGSGTTGIACLNIERKFIGVEKDKKHFDVAEKRLVDLKEQKAKELTRFMKMIRWT